MGLFVVEAASSRVRGTRDGLWVTRGLAISLSVVVECTLIGERSIGALGSGDECTMGLVVEEAANLESATA